MRLLLMRHAQAVPGADTDANRSLTESARERLSHLEPGVEVELEKVSLVLSSPWLRTRQTVDAIGAGILSHTALILSESLLPNADIQSVVCLLERYCAADATLLVVSHQPLIGRLISYLIEGEQGAAVSPAPGELAVIDLEWPAAGMGFLRCWYRL